MRPTVEPLGDRLLPTNFVFVLLDDARSDSLRYMPRTRRLFEDGARFSRAFVTTPVCCPSRATYLTGQYAHHHGVETNKDILALDDTHTLATIFDDAGYRTGLVGKYLNGYRTTTVPPGWDDWHAFASKSGSQGFYYDYRLNENGVKHDYGTRARHYSTDVLRRKAVRFVEAAADDDSPWFLYFAPYAPHQPAIPAPRHHDLDVSPGGRPPSHNERDVSDKPSWVRREPLWDAGRVAKIRDKEVQAARSLAAVDQAVAALFRAARDAGEFDDTVFVLASDNGFLFGEHRLVAKAWPYEETIRVPLLVLDGGADAAGLADSEHLVANIDFLPTVLDYAGLDPDDQADGVSFRLLVEGDDPADWRAEFLIESAQVRAGARPWRGLRGEDYAYVEYRGGEEEYYDLARDPYQLINRIDDPDYADLVDAARDLLAEY